MSDADEIHYTRAEIRSYLPTGWRLGHGDDEGCWDPALRVWSATVQDGSDFEWPLSVKLDDIRVEGRLEALKSRLEALSRGGTHRDRLRRP